MKKCKNCGELNNNDSVFCCNCGRDAFVMCEDVTCPHCGAINDASFEHCTNCGNVLTQESSEAPENNGGLTPIDVRTELNLQNGISVVPHGETSKCPSCGADVSINAIYCSNCGASVSELHQNRVLRRKICPHCGRPNLSESAYCSYCYHSLANAEFEDMQLVHDNVQTGALSVKRAFVSGSHGKSRICNNCGTLNDNAELFCVSCGLKLEIEEPKQYCPNCGQENDADSKFCSKCQWSFDGTAPDKINNKWKCKKCDALNESENEYCINCGNKKG